MVATRLTRNNEKSRKATSGKKRNRATSEVSTGGKTELTTRVKRVKKDTGEAGKGIKAFYGGRAPGEIEISSRRSSRGK